jgi:hypothetical protein
MKAKKKRRKQSNKGVTAQSRREEMGMKEAKKKRWKAKQQRGEKPSQEETRRG